MAESKDFLIKEETLTNIANSIRNVDNTLKELSPSEMSEEIRRLTAIIEQDFDGNSPNAQSGKAVAKAVSVEQENREIADTNLQTQINTNKADLTKEITDRKTVDSALEQKISDITAIQIRNKSEVIESTEANVQTVATQYIVDNYQRQPQNFDGLIITVTDKNNNKILSVYTEVSNLWINSGINDVDLSNYYTKNEINTKVEDINQAIASINKQTISFDIYSSKDTFETVTVLIPAKETV